MKNPFEALKMHLLKSAENGSQSAVLFVQIALFTATLFLRETRLYSEHDSHGIKTALSYQITSAVLVSHLRHLSRLGFIHRKCGSIINSIANLICLILAILFENFYEKSFSSLGFALTITILLLILLVIIRPSTDLGLFGFLIGVIGSVAYNLFGLKFQTWIVVAICFPLLGFRCWLDKNWLQLGADQSLPTTRSTGRRNQISKSGIIEAITVAGFHLFWAYILFRTNCRQIKVPPKSISCTLSSIVGKGMLASVLIFSLWFALALIPRVYSLFQTEATATPSNMRRSVSTNSALAHFEEEDIVESRRAATMREGKVSEEVDDEVDAKADDFINRFKNQLKLQRIDSIIRYKDPWRKRKMN